MYEIETTVVIEVPSDILQQEIWDVEERCKWIEGIKTDFHETKDIFANSIMILQIAISVAGTIVTLNEGTKAVREVAKVFYDFLHQSNKGQAAKDAKKKVVIVKKGKRIELYNLSVEEIERILKDQ